MIPSKEQPANDQYTVLLIHSDTTNGSTTFVDSSPPGHLLVSARGTPDHRTAQAKFGASSIYFDGSERIDAGYINHPDFDLGLGPPFTIDLWMYPTTDSGEQYLVGEQSSQSYQGAWQFNVLGQGSNTFRMSASFTLGSSAIPGTHGMWMTTDATFATNNWYHVVFTREEAVPIGNTPVLGFHYIYVNGIKYGWRTGIRDDSDSRQLYLNENWPGDVEDESKLQIGSGRTSYGFTGYMDEIRISKGVARWKHNFTPPTRAYQNFVEGELYYDAGKDQVKVMSQDVIDSATKLLIHGNAADGSTTFTDSSPSAHTISRAGSPGVTHSTTYPHFGGGTTGSAFKFPGGVAGNYLQVADHADWDVGLDDFTIDGWCYFVNSGADNNYDNIWKQGGNFQFCRQQSTNKLYMFTGSNSGGGSTNELADGAWRHVAVCREEKTITAYVDGVKTFQYYDATDLNYSAGVTMGPDNTTNGSHMYLDEIRFTKGIARWTADFTPPKGPYPLKSIVTASSKFRHSEASGGIEKIYTSNADGADYKCHIFEGSGVLKVHSHISYDLLVVAGGGGGATQHSGGGGGGAVKILPARYMGPGTYYAIVGAGGTATNLINHNGYAQLWKNGQNGGDSSFDGQVCNGGGGGGSYPNYSGRTGGNGGGGGSDSGGAGAQNQGFVGGAGAAHNSSGGGGGGGGGAGGAGAAAVTGSGNGAGDGGPGKLCDYTGTNFYWAGGGGGGNIQGSTASGGDGGIGGGGGGGVTGGGSDNQGRGGVGAYKGHSGETPLTHTPNVQEGGRGGRNTGGGGGGGGGYQYKAGSGGCGIVVVRYRI